MTAFNVVSVAFNVVSVAFNVVGVTFNVVGVAFNVVYMTFNAATKPSRSFVTIVTNDSAFSAHFGGLEAGRKIDKYKKMNKLNYYHIYIIIYIYPISTPPKTLYLFVFMQKL